MTEKIDFTKDSEYIRMFEDHTEAMKKAECFNAIVEGMKILGWDEEEDKKRPPPMPPKSPYKQFAYTKYKVYNKGNLIRKVRKWNQQYTRLMLK